MKEGDFCKLKAILGKSDLLELFQSNDIPHEVIIGRGGSKEIILEESDHIAELVGIILGDGYLGLNGMDVEIAFNYADEGRYYNYVKKLLRRTIKGINIAEKTITGTKGVKLVVTNKAVHNAFVMMGLLPGDKVENQVRIPKWIFNKRSYMISCVKGLFDTDGSITVSKKTKSMIINFSSSSKPLVVGFFKICKGLNIKSGNIGGPYASIDRRTGKQYFNYNVRIESIQGVKKFLNLLKPEKFLEHYRYKWLGLTLNYLNAPIKLKNRIEE